MDGDLFVSLTEDEGLYVRCADSWVSARQTLEGLSRAEQSFLLYAESCSVDQRGALCDTRCNAEDWAAADSLRDKGLLTYGRIATIRKVVDGQVTYTLPTENGAGRYACSKWVKLTPLGWAVVWTLRHRRAERTAELREWQTTDEVQAEEASPPEVPFVEDPNPYAGGH